MRISRTLRLTSIAASVLLGAGVLAGPSAAAPAERPGPGISALSGPAVNAQSSSVRSGHVIDRANDVLRLDRSVTDVHARTIDINRFGYAFGQQNAKFTIRTRDLRNVANRRTYFAVVTTARSTAGEEEFSIEAIGSRVAVFTESGYKRICAEASVVRDAARNTVTLRTPLRCITGRTAPSSLQSWALTGLTDRSDELLAFDETYMTPRIAMRR